MSTFQKEELSSTYVNKRSRNKCTSCRKLKIKCDEGKPACEYCQHMKKVCIYSMISKIKTKRRKRVSEGVGKSTRRLEENIELKKNVEVIKSFENEKPDFCLSMNVYSQLPEGKTGVYMVESDVKFMVSRYQHSLNSISNQLNITIFEGRLLYYFHEVYIHSSIDPTQSFSVWSCEVPKLWQQSKLMRKCIYSLSALHLGSLSYISGLIQEDSTNHENIRKANTLARSEQSIFGVNVLEENNRKHYFEINSLYFDECLKHTIDMVNALSAGSKVETVFQAAEIFFSEVLIFTILILHPKRIVPVLTFNRNETDLISICRGMKGLMTASFPLLINTQYSGIFLDSNGVDISTIPRDKYPLTDHLLDELKKHDSEEFFTEKEFQCYKRAIEILECTISKMIYFGSTNPFPKWIFLIDDEIYDYIKINKAHFAIKLLFMYSCIAMACQFRLHKQKSIFLDFIHWYRNFNFEIYNSWKDEEDKYFYSLLINDFEFRSMNDFHFFLPSKVHKS